MKQKNRKSLLKATLAISTLVLTGCFSSSGTEENVYYYDDHAAYESVPQDQVVFADESEQNIFVEDVFVEESACPTKCTSKKRKTVSSSVPAEPNVIPVKPSCGQICTKKETTTTKQTVKAEASKAEIAQKQSLETATKKATVKEKPEAPAPTPAKIIPDDPIIVEYVSETVETKQTTQDAKPAEKAQNAQVEKQVVVETKVIGNPVPVIGESEDYVQDDETVVQTETVVESEAQSKVQEEQQSVFADDDQIEEVIVTTTTVEEQDAQAERQKAVEEIRQQVEEEQVEIERLKAQAEQLNEQRKALEAKTQVTEQTMQQTTPPCEVGEEVKDWVASEGSTLRTLLMEWGNQVGWRVVWNMDRDYTLEAGAVFRGRFVEVAAALLRSFARATPAPKGVFYKGNKVLVVSTREDENAD